MILNQYSISGNAGTTNKVGISGNDGSTGIARNTSLTGS
jgi:hypothetical protein